MIDDEPKRSKFADTKFTGIEPPKNVNILTNNDPQYRHAHYWYNYYFDVDDTKDWLTNYLQTNSYDQKIVKYIKSLPSWKISPTIGRIAKLLSRGWSLPSDTIDFFKKSIEDLTKSSVVVDPPVIKKTTTNPQDRVSAKVSDILAKFDAHVDSFSSDQSYKFSLYNFLTVEKSPPAATTAILSLAKDMVTEIEAKEGYEYLTKEQQKKYVLFFKTCVNDCNSFLTNAKTMKKTTRKPRKVREKSAEKLVSKVKYLKEAPELKLVSILPQEIIKAQSVWVYDNKYRKLTVYNSKGPEGLTVKGTTILNFDENTSIQKRLRKPEEILPQVTSGGKVTLRKLMDQIKTIHIVPTGRLNGDIIIIRAIK